MTGFSILGLVDPPGRVVDGQIRFNGEELIGLPEEQMRRIRGNRMAMVFQDPMMTLNPVLRIDTQMIEAIWRMSQSGRKRHVSGHGTRWGRWAFHLRTNGFRHTRISFPGECASVSPLRSPCSTSRI